MDKNVVIFGVENSLSVQSVLVLVQRATDGLDDTTITAGAKYSVNITKSRKEICLSLHYNAAKKNLCVHVCVCLRVFNFFFTGEATIKVIQELRRWYAVEMLMYEGPMLPRQIN